MKARKRGRRERERERAGGESKSRELPVSRTKGWGPVERNGERTMRKKKRAERTAAGRGKRGMERRLQGSIM